MPSPVACASAIGIDIGGTHIRAARMRGGAVEARAAAASSRDSREVLARCLGLIDEVRTPGVSAIGIGIPGRVDARTRRALSGGFVDLSGFDFCAEVEGATGLPVAIENDATMALLAEAGFGTAKGAANAVMLTVGTGIGGAILDHGRVLRGAATAGQLGHIVVEPDGRHCLCGRTGCVETTSSGTAFARLVAEAGLPGGTSVEELLARADARARSVIDAWASPLRRAIDSLVAVLNPEVVVVGGGLGTAAVAALETVPEAGGWYRAPVLAAALGDDAGVIGAARAALDAVRDAAGAKRAVLVNGVPASGKSGVARALSDATGWPILAIDTLKAPFLAALPPGDRVFNRTLGRASYAAIFDTMAEAPRGSTFIIDAWFGFQPLELLDEGLARAGVSRAAELWCTAPPETIGARYLARVPERPSGHPGADYVPELIELAARAAPTGRAPRLDIDTTQPLDLARLTAWLGEVL